MMILRDELHPVKDGWQEAAIARPSTRFWDDFRHPEH
jgi:hypothetical protein